jgi:hypothetical protein
MVQHNFYRFFNMFSPQTQIWHKSVVLLLSGFLPHYNVIETHWYLVVLNGHKCRVQVLDSTGTATRRPEVEQLVTYWSSTSYYIKNYTHGYLNCWWLYWTQIQGLKNHLDRLAELKLIRKH